MLIILGYLLVAYLLVLVCCVCVAYRAFKGWNKLDSESKGKLQLADQGGNKKQSKRELYIESIAQNNPVMLKTIGQLDKQADRLRGSRRNSSMSAIEESQEAPKEA